MGKKKSKQKVDAAGEATERMADQTASNETAKERNKRYEKELERLQVELAHLQAWVKETGAKVVIVFEGRDAAGKGGLIRRITERLSPRVFRIAALPSPSDREKSQIYIQRYLAHFPAAGEVVIFDRSWYNRAGVERVMGFCSEKAAKRFIEVCPEFEKAMVASGIILLKYFLTVSQQEQERRFHRRLDDPLRQWKLSPMDTESYRRWWQYSRAYDEMLRLTDSPHAPWWIVQSEDKKAARINCISHILKSIPYHPVKFDKPHLGKRDKKPDDYVEDTTARNVVTDVFEAGRPAP